MPQSYQPSRLVRKVVHNDFHFVEPLASVGARSETEVLGAPTPDGNFLEVQPGYFLPMRLEQKQVLFEVGPTLSLAGAVSHGSAQASREKPPPMWHVHTHDPKLSEIIGVKYRKSMHMKAKMQKVDAVPWGSYVNGVKVDDRWVKVGNYFLPIFLNDHQILWEVSTCAKFLFRVELIHVALTQPATDFRTSPTASDWPTCACFLAHWH